ncbi:MAG: glutamate--cysteine ligase [Bacteroidia bacterium]|nr:glutamate--cysteine ligase [Bacteroidia bacterium]
MTHSRLHLFQGYGIELEYMIVDRDSLEVKSISDELLKHELGVYGSDFDNGLVTWSNEIVLHVVELKSSKPEWDFEPLQISFHENIRLINNILSERNAMLLPTAAHPFMVPSKETKLWPHDNNEVYTVYNAIFDCSGHGWSNLQSTHLNLPFGDQKEFAKLHAAIRIILPLLPALCASSPILDGKPTGVADTRLTYYKTNQSRIPSITGQIIPEAVDSEAEYHEVIFKKIKKDIEPFDPENILDPIWVNSRGAITRFDRGSIEIRIMDVQECPSADLAIVTLVIETLKALTAERFMSMNEQMKWDVAPLAALLDKTIVDGSHAIFENTDYLKIFGINKGTATAKEIWQTIIAYHTKTGNVMLNKYMPELTVILEEGTLSDRILKSLDGNYSIEDLKKVYKQLALCLAENKMFLAM